MGAPQDSNLMFRTGATNLTAIFTSASIKLQGVPIHRLAVQAVVPSAGGADDTISLAVYTSLDDSSFVRAADTGAVKIGVSGGELFLPIPMDSGVKTYVKIELAVTGTTTNFGKVTAGIVLGGGAKLDRTTHFS